MRPFGGKNSFKKLAEKIQGLSQSSVNKFFFRQRVLGGYLNLLTQSSTAKYPKESALQMAATGQLDLDLVYHTNF